MKNNRNQNKLISNKIARQREDIILQVNDKYSQGLTEHMHMYLKQWFRPVSVLGKNQLWSYPEKGIGGKTSTV